MKLHLASRAFLVLKYEDVDIATVTNIYFQLGLQALLRVNIFIFKFTFRKHLFALKA